MEKGENSMKNMMIVLSALFAMSAFANEHAAAPAAAETHATEATHAEKPVKKAKKK